MSNYCTNLLHRYGHRYKVFHDIEGRPAKPRDDPWDHVLVGSRGDVVPWGRDGRLAAITHSLVTTKRLLAAIPDAKVEQDGDDGANITFEPEHLDVVAAILKLRRKRQYTPTQREAAAARLAKVRPKPLPKPLNGGSVSTQIPPIDRSAGGNPPEQK
jgi:hypothetical protein